MAHRWPVIGRQHYKDDNCKLSIVKLDTFVGYINNGTIVIPDFQRDQDEDKIEEIVNTYKDKKLKGRNWFIEQGQINLCVIPMDGYNKLYVVDGQHRIEAMQRLKRDDYLSDDVMTINIAKCNSLEEMKEFYSKLNINSNIPIIYNNIEDIFLVNELLKVKNALKQTYKSMFSRTKGINSKAQFYHIDDFIDKFNVPMLKNNWPVEDITFENIWEKLMYVNELVIKKIDKIKQKECIGRFAIAGNMNKMSDNDFYLSYKSGVQWDMFADDYGIRIIVKKYKGDIKKAIRDKVWRRDFSDTLTGKCYCCEDDVKIENYECGHVISEYNGGKTEVSNLRVVCGGCNKSMGIMHMDDFKEMFN
jgi:hypothetical protein